PAEHDRSSHGTATVSFSYRSIPNAQQSDVLRYNMLAREKVEREYSLLYEYYDIGLTTFSPLKTGILTGKYNDGIPEDSRIANASDNFTKSQKEKYGDPVWQAEIAQV